jgi:hypothetical protein
MIEYMAFLLPVRYISYCMDARLHGNYSFSVYLIYLINAID